MLAIVGQFIASDKNLPVLTSKPFFKTQYFLVVRNEIKLNASFLQLQVFSLNGWLMILAAVLYMGFAVDMIYHGCSRKSIKVKPFLNRIGDIIFNSVGHCFMKESAPPDAVAAEKVVLFGFTLFSFIIMATLSGAITADLVKAQTP